MNRLYRNPAPSGNDPADYTDPVTFPSGDIAENPYWKRDVRRSYPQLSVVNQGRVVGLLSVGSKESPKDEVLQIGDAGTKQLVAVQEEGQKGLSAFFEKDKKNMMGIFGANGLPPVPANLAPKVASSRYELLAEQTYEGKYVSVFSLTRGQRLTSG